MARSTRGGQVRATRPRRVDPEVRAARRARLARLGRRSAVAVVVVTALGGSVWGVAWFTAPETFPLEAVHFETRLEHVREQELREALDPHLGGGFWGLDVERIRAALEDLPWVDRAAVRRAWPGRLRVEITEQQAAAVWNGDALLNPRGEVFAAPEETWPSGLPELAGPEERSEDVAAGFERLDDALEALELSVRAVNMDARESWSAELAGGAELKLGRNEIDQRLARFVAAYPGIREEAGQELAGVDLRYPNGFAVTWRERASN